MCDVTPVAEATFEKSLQSPAVVREFVEQNACVEHGSRGTVALQLLASELVTNAVLYGTPPIRARISCDGYSMRVEVHDEGGGEPGELSGESSGFLLVNKVAHDWGASPSKTGRTFWCTIRTGVVPGQAEPPWAESATLRTVEEAGSTVRSSAH